MRTRSKPDVEKLLANEFLRDALGISVTTLVSQSEPRPDVYASVEDNGRMLKLQIELTEYHIDASRRQKGGSPGMRSQRLWRAVQASLGRRLTRAPLNVDVHVRLKDPLKTSESIALPLAAELVEFARRFDFGLSTAAVATAFGAKFPLLREHVHRLRLTKVTFNSFHWTCANISAAAVGLLPDRVAELIESKNRKTYSWFPNAERWLLICASGSAIVGTAGPRPLGPTWRNVRIEAACTSSPFDRIYFWDRPHEWHEGLK